MKVVTTGLTTGEPEHGPWTAGSVERSDTHQYRRCGDGYRFAPPILRISNTSSCTVMRPKFFRKPCPRNQRAQGRPGNITAQKVNAAEGMPVLPLTHHQQLAHYGNSY